MRTALAVVLVLLAGLAPALAQDYVPDPNAPRSETPAAYHWRTDHIYADEAAWEQALAGFQADLPAMAAYQGRLGESSQVLLEALEMAQDLDLRLNRLWSYASLSSDVDQSDDAAMARLGRVQNLLPTYGRTVSFLEPEILSLDEATLQQWMEQNQGLAVYAYALQDMLRQKEHTLGEEEERILALAGGLQSAPGNVYRALTGQDLVFDEIVDPAGEKVRLTQSGFPRYRSTEPFNVRKQAAETLFAGFRSVENTAAAALDAEVKGHILTKEARGYESCLEAALDPDNISPQAYRMLVETVRANLPRTLHRYVELRRKVLGLDGPLTFANLYNPLLSEATREYTWPQCRELVLEALQPLGEDYHQKLAEGLDPASGWVDLYPNLHKESGAYSNGSLAGDLHPFVKMNYDNSLDAVFTMAHEMGHAMHSIYSRRTQPAVYGDYPSFLAEIASTCNEQLLLGRLLEQAEDTQTKLMLLNQRLEKIRLTIMRQTLFAEFELRYHEHAEAGEPLTAEYLDQLYASLIQDYYGPDFALGDNDEVEWAYIPHFYMNFYVYSYATGLTSGISLAQQIQDGGEEVAQRYIHELLSAGNSRPPLESLKAAGVDLETPAPILDMLDLFEQTVEDFDRLWTESRGL